MSDFIVRDGTGKGNRAKVDDNNRLRMSGVTQSEIYDASNNGLAFAFPANELSIPATEASVFWLQNTDATRNFHIQRVYAFWNGGSTSHNRTMVARFYATSSAVAPSANNVAMSPINLNTTSNNVPVTTAWKWNGTGTGMTVASNGVLAFTGYTGQGHTPIEFEGAFVIGYNKAINITLQGEEAGLAGIVMSGWYENLGSE